MRVLFVSSTMGGGSGRSQRELAARLVARGHEIEFLVDDKRQAKLRRATYEQLSDLAVRLGDGSSARLIRRFEALPGRIGRASEKDGLLHRITPIPQNAISLLLARNSPDVVVANSVTRLTWRRILLQCRIAAVPTILYVRETATLPHLERRADVPDAVVANAASLRDAVEALDIPCGLVPSVIDTTPTLVESSRQVALLVNPIESHGVGLLWLLAERLPEVRFELRESWPITGSERALLLERCAASKNVSLREREPPGPSIYGDARALLVPHQLDNRPRVVAEAQANAIPALVSDFPGLREAVGDGGVVLPSDSVDAWVEAVRGIMSDGDDYSNLCDRALEHSRRAEINPDAVVDGFEALLAQVTGSAQGNGDSTRLQQ